MENETNYPPKSDADNVNAGAPSGFSLHLAKKKFPATPLYIAVASVTDLQAKYPIDLIDSMWRSPDFIHQTGELDRATGKFTNKHAKDAATAVERAKALSADGKEAYFACAEYLSANSRTAENAAGAYGLWIDIDCGDDKAADGKGYLTEEVARQELRRFCNVIGLPESTHIVSSGSGFHAYWVLNSFVERAEWQCYARKLKDLTHALKLLADDSRTADIASVLRVPGTLNYKYNPPKPVVLLQSSSQFIEKALMLSKIDMAHQSLCPVVEANVQVKAVSGRSDISMVSALLKNISPDIGYKEWTSVGMAVNQETAGSEEGFDLYNDWSGLGKDYPGIAVMRTKWKSFETDRVDTYNLGTLINMAKAGGADLSSVIGFAGEQFELCETEVVHSGQKATKPPEIPVSSEKASKAVVVSKQSGTPFDRFSLRGQSAEIEKSVVDAIPVLGQIALMGQATVLYAAPNTGKTLITLSLLIDAIKGDIVDPSKVYYLNMDDTGTGLLTKVRIGEEYDFHMLAEGYRDFGAVAFLSIVRDMIDEDQAQGVVIVLDTLKKFVDLMDKGRTSIFTNVIRPFVSKGGTVIALAHTNKNPGKNGKPVYGGVSDILNDVDCAYTIAEVSDDAGSKVVEFENIKRRGNVVKSAAYSYCSGNNTPYTELLLSVEPFDETQLEPLKQAEAIKSDAELIAVVAACIGDGINTKMKLAEAVAQRAGISKRSALQLINKYTGEDVALHRWKFAVAAHRTYVYVMLDLPSVAPDMVL